MAEFSAAAAATTEEQPMTLSEMNSEILENARYGENEELESFLKAGADVNFVVTQGNTCMHRAAANGEVECMKVLQQFDAKLVANGEGVYAPRHSE
jgi:ankyrin repeat protein